MSEQPQAVDLTPKPVVDSHALQALQWTVQWHQMLISNMNTLLDNVKPGMTLNLGDENGTKQQITLNEDQSKGFQTALLLMLSQAAVLPFSLQGPEGEAPTIEAPQS